MMIRRTPLQCLHSIDPEVHKFSICRVFGFRDMSKCTPVDCERYQIIVGHEEVSLWDTLVNSDRQSAALSLL